MQRREREYQCIHKIFETQVLIRPESPALICSGATLSYRELNRQANQLAHYLMKLGVQAETPVGLCVERSLEMVVGILGILKAGGAYVPLDPLFPEERLAFMLDDTKVPVLLTQRQLMGGLLDNVVEPRHGIEPVYLDSDWETIAHESDENPTSQVSAENLAYVMYTSGSTGLPKGVEIPHRSIIGFMFDVDYIHLDATQVFLQHSSISWDALTLELWPALLYGACCVIYPGQIATPGELGETIQRYGVTILWLTASLFNTMVDTMPEALAGVQQLLIGGEALSTSHVRRALELLPLTQIVNGYGPSECTVFACCYRIPRPLEKNIHSIPIGRPVGDRRVYLLDSRQNRVPVGVHGELHIGGPSLARCYHNRPELTAEKFIPNPFSREPGTRLYKTGDRARYMADGRIEFLGRTDNQVKLRGFRIELGEIETVLHQHPAIKEVALLIREDMVDNKHLVAYIVPVQTATISIGEIQSFLRTKLPSYMLPSAYILLEALPLTTNRKLDHRALPTPDWTTRELEAEYIAPQTEMEGIIARIWQELLQAEKVSTHANFFDLGGYSLLMAQAQSKLREVLNRDISITLMFQHPTISSLAKALTQEHSDPSSTRRIQDRVESRKELLKQQMSRPRRRIAQE